MQYRRAGERNARAHAHALSSSARCSYGFDVRAYHYCVRPAKRVGLGEQPGVKREFGETEARPGSASAGRAPRNRAVGSVCVSAQALTLLARRDGS
jgi:hypothetical protein